MKKSIIDGLLSNEGLVNKLYDDTIKTPMATGSKAVNDVLKFVSLPFTFLGLTADELTIKYKEFISNSLEKTPPKKFTKPKAVVVSPLLENVKFVFEEEDLRDMYSNLLACAMNSDITSLVHPAFVEVLKQMSPLDAKLFRDLFVDSDSTYIERIKWNFDDSFKLLSIESLERLGLVFQSIVNETLETKIGLTNFGCIFYQLCVEDNANISDSELLLAIRTRTDYYQFDTDAEKLGFTVKLINTVSELSVFEFSEDMTKVQEGLPALCFCIQNNDRSTICIDELFIEVEARVAGKKVFHKIPHKSNIFPYNLDALSYKNFIFDSLEKDNIIKSMKKGKAKVKIVTGTITYDFDLSVIFQMFY